MSGKRIRTIKPEWLEDERLATCSDTARLVSVALIVLADDYGNGRAHHLYLTSRIWPYASCDPHESLASVSRALHELLAIGFVQLYEVKGQTYYNVTNWKRHQRIDRPSQPLVPAPNGKDETLASPSRKTRESLATPSRDTRAGLGIGIGIGGGRAIPVPGSTGGAPGSTCPPTPPTAPSQKFTESASAVPIGKAAEHSNVAAKNGPSRLWEIWQELVGLPAKAAPNEQAQSWLATARAKLVERGVPDPEDFFARMATAYIAHRRHRRKELELKFCCEDDFDKWAEFVARATGNGPSISLLPAYQPYPELEKVPR